MTGEGSSSVASRTRGAMKKGNPDEHPNLLWKGVGKAEKRTLNKRLNRLYFREIDVPRIMDRRIMRNLGCEEVLEDMLLVKVVIGHEYVTSQMWKRALEIKEPIYMEWCLEFFSSLSVKKEISDEGILEDKFMKFRLGGVERSVTLLEFGKLLGIYSEQEMGSTTFEPLIMIGEKTIWNFDADEFWKEISGEDVRVYGKRRVWKIRNPMLQVLHKVMVKSILHREYNEQYVLDLNLWILYVFFKNHHLSNLNLAWLIALHLGDGAVTAGGTRICSGHMVTRIAKSLGLFNEEEMELFGEPVMCKYVEMKSFWNLKDVETGRLKDLPEVLEVEPINEW